MCSSNCECNAQTIMKNQQLIYDKLKEMEQKSCLWTEERICWLEEQVLRNGLETKNHDIKIVRILESMGGVATVEEQLLNEALSVVDYVEEVPTTKKKKTKKEEQNV